MMAHTLLMVGILSGLLGLSPSALAAQPRRALLIGNATYAQSPLRNPVHDATDMATLLRSLGFEVTLHANADKPTMERAIVDFTRGVPAGSIGLFYYSGHGVQIEGLNYLLPIGGAFTQPTDVKYHAVAADWLLGRMDDSGMTVKLVILDACRNNPFGRSWTRALDRGLATMDAPQGSLIAYATSPQKTASDGTGRNSPYTAHLLREIPLPGRPIELLFKAVRVGVQQETQGAQIPWEASSLTGDFYFAASDVPGASTPPPSLTSPNAASQDVHPPDVAPLPSFSRPPSPAVLPSSGHTAPEGTGDLDHPLQADLGILTQVSLEKDERRHFGVALPAGEFKLILDARRANAKWGHLWSTVSILDHDGGELQKDVIVMNVLDFQHRAVHYFSLSSPLHLILKLDNKQEKATYWLSVYEQAAGAPPLFGSVVPQPLQPGETQTGTMEKDHDAHYRIALTPGSYKAFLDFGSTNGKHTNLIGSLQLLNTDGGLLNNLIGINQFESAYRATAAFTVKEDGVYLLRVYNQGVPVENSGGSFTGLYRVKYTTKIVPGMPQ